VMESPSTAELADATRAGAPSAALAELVEGRHAIV